MNVTWVSPCGEIAVHFPPSFLTDHLNEPISNRAVSDSRYCLMKLAGKSHLLQELFGYVVEPLPSYGLDFTADQNLDGVRSSAEGFLELVLEFVVRSNLIDLFVDGLSPMQLGQNLRQVCDRSRVFFNLGLILGDTLSFHFS